MFRKIPALAIATLVLLTSMLPARSETEFIPITSADEGEGIVSIKELNQIGVSTRFGQPIDSNGRTSMQHLCPEGPEANATCNYDKMDGVSFGSRAVLPVCSEPSEENCVNRVRFEDIDGNLIAAEFVRNIDMSTYQYEDLAKGLFRTGQSSIWRFPGRVHSGGHDRYFVAVATDMHFDKPNQNYSVTSLRAVISPFIEVSGDYSRVGLRYIDCELGSLGCIAGKRIDGWSRFECVWQEAGICGKAANFAEDFRAELEIRAASSLVGWFRGRISDPSISIQDFSPTNKVFRISARPVSVPRFEAIITDANTDHYQQKLAEDGTDETSGYPAPGYVGPRIFGGDIAKGQHAMTPKAIEWIAAFRHVTQDSAIAITSHWNFETTNYAGRNECLGKQDGVLGIVSTNATAMLGTPPEYENGQLSYVVAGLHFAPDGKTVNLGTYDLVMRSDVARCLYGFSKAPISATIQVLDDKGEEVVATTVVSEKDGWLKLAAYGFTYSEKEIKVQVKQAQNKTLTAYRGNVATLTTKQKAEIRATVNKGGANSKFICTGIRLEGQPQALNTLVRKRAKLACDYAKSLNPKLSTFYQTKTTKARSYNGKVLVVSK